MSIKLPKPQMLRQQAERDCSVPVFAAVAGVSEDNVRRDFPEAAVGGVSVLDWVHWLERQGFVVLNRSGCPDDVVPCVHLVATHEPRGPDDFHWIYRDLDGDVHDPSPVFQFMPADDPRMRDLSVYAEKVLTLCVSVPVQKICTGS